MKYNKIKIIFFLILLFSLVGCVKVPEKVKSPSLKIDSIIKNNKELYKIQFTCGIEQYNSEDALVDVKGNIIFIDPNNKNSIIKLSFDIPVLLPFATEIIDLERVAEEDEIIPLTSLLDINKDEFMETKSIEGMFVDEKYIDLEIISYQSKSITDLLEGKINEKN